MKIKLFVITILLVFCIAATPQKKAIILAGQSNMGKSAAEIRERMPDYKIINCSVGGSSITSWQRNQENYDHCLKMVKAVQRDGYVISAMFFFQGEKDTVSYNTSRLWKRLFYSFVFNFRKDAGVRVPVIFAQLGKKVEGHRQWNRVQNLQRLSANDSKQLYMITTDDIVPYCPAQGPHFCPEGYTEIAQRFVDKFNAVK